MTEEQILALAVDYFDNEEGMVVGTPEQLLNFARAVYEIGYEIGNENGWDSRAESEYLNSSSLFVGDDE